MALQKGIDRCQHLFDGWYLHEQRYMSDCFDIATTFCQIYLMLPRNPQISSSYGMTKTAGEQIFDKLILIMPEGMTKNRWATEAKLNRNVFNDLRKHGNPERQTLRKLLDVIDMSPAHFESLKVEYSDEGDVIGLHSDDPGGADASNVVELPVLDKMRRQPKDVPVVGTASCGTHEVAGTGSIEAMEVSTGDPIDFVRRPHSLDQRRDVYAIYFNGTSMSPKFEPGEPAFVDPNRSPTVMDYVIVQLRSDNGADGEEVVKVLAKQLVKQTADHIELLQHEPKITFKIDRNRVKAIHRIIPWSEVIGF